jgi:hypothetical protein
VVVTQRRIHNGRYTAANIVADIQRQIRSGRYSSGYTVVDTQMRILSGGYTAVGTVVYFQIKIHMLSGITLLVDIQQHIHSRGYSSVFRIADLDIHALQDNPSGVYIATDTQWNSMHSAGYSPAQIGLTRPHPEQSQTDGMVVNTVTTSHPAS